MTMLTESIGGHETTWEKFLQRGTSLAKAGMKEETLDPLFEESHAAALRRLYRHNSGTCTAFLVRVADEAGILPQMRFGDSGVHRIGWYKRAGIDSSERKMVDVVHDKQWKKDQNGIRFKPHDVLYLDNGTRWQDAMRRSLIQITEGDTMFRYVIYSLTLV